MTWLRSAALADGQVVDVELNSTAATITAIEPARRSTPRRATDELIRANQQQPDEIDLDGYLLLPAFAEPHAHLDKALTAELIPNPRGDLSGAIEAWIAQAGEITKADMIDRARSAALELLHSGATAVRTHVNVHGGVETDAVEALLVVRNELAPLMDIQIVALCGIPLTGAEGSHTRGLLHDVLSMDRSIIVGGCPHLDADPIAATEYALDIAGQFGRSIDLHTDETLDPSHLDVELLAQRVIEREFPYGVVASHCVSLAMQDIATQQRVAELVARAGVHVVALPQTNLFLQGRDVRVGPPRGLTAVRTLLDAGANVAAGADNVRDPFNAMGRSDPLETAALMVMAGHLLPAEALSCVTERARRAMGLPDFLLQVGSPAELVALRGASIGDVIARADQQRLVFHAGRLVASTSVTRATAFTSP